MDIKGLIKEVERLQNIKINYEAVCKDNGYVDEKLEGIKATVEAVNNWTECYFDEDWQKLKKLLGVK